jgi:small subunit ribosomal protein S18
VFCASKVEWVDYKDVNTLRRLMSDRGKIKARRVTGTCRQHQRDVAIAIKTARELALLPYALTPASADKGGRRGGPREGRGGGDGRSTAPVAEAEAEAGEDVEDTEPELVEADTERS